MLQAAGWALWFSDQVCWIVFDLVLKKKVPAMYPADALLFLAGAPMIAGLLLRPHRQSSERSARLGLSGFSPVCSCGGSISTFPSLCAGNMSRRMKTCTTGISICSPARKPYCSPGFCSSFWQESSGRWKKFYAFFCGAVIFNGIAFYVLNRALENDVYLHRELVRHPVLRIVRALQCGRAAGTVTYRRLRQALEMILTIR